jgi:hypothetical protein
MLVEGTFKELFADVETQKNEAGIEMSEPDVPAVFEVKMLDLANDIYNEADSYRSETTIAVAMKSPGGKVLWQESFRGEGYVNVDPQFSNNLGPQDAVVSAVNDALDQMQKAMINSPAVRGQLKYYAQSKQAKQGTEQNL